MRHSNLCAPFLRWDEADLVRPCYAISLLSAFKDATLSLALEVVVCLAGDGDEHSTERAFKSPWRTRIMFRL